MTLKVGREIFNITGQDFFVLIDQKATLSGDYLKHINYLRPSVIERVKAELAKDNTLGRVMEFESFIFIVARNSYRNVWTPERKKFATDIIYNIIEERPETRFKTTEDYNFLELEHDRLEIINW